MGHAQPLLRQNYASVARFQSLSVRQARLAVRFRREGSLAKVDKTAGRLGRALKWAESRPMKTRGGGSR